MRPRLTPAARRAVISLSLASRPYTLQVAKSVAAGIVYGSMLGIISGMMVKICAGARPRCDASATSPPSRNRPVRLTSVMPKIFSKSQKIIRCKVVPTQCFSTLALTGRARLGVHSSKQSLYRLDEDRHGLGAQVQLPAKRAGHLDLVKVTADCGRHLQRLHEARQDRVDVELHAAAVELHLALAREADEVADKVNFVEVHGHALDLELGEGLLEEGAVGRAALDELQQV